MAQIASVSISFIGVSRALGMMVSFGDAERSDFSASRNEVAITKSHQAGVTKVLPHENACREQRSKSVQNTNKKSQ